MGSYQLSHREPSLVVAFLLISATQWKMIILPFYDGKIYCSQKEGRTYEQ